MSVTSADVCEKNPENITKFWKTEFDALYDEICELKKNY
jgi:hypothetical protein